LFLRASRKQHESIIRAHLGKRFGPAANILTLLISVPNTAIELG